MALCLAPDLCGAEQAPQWHIEGSHRLRYEALAHPYRPTVVGRDELAVSRLLLGISMRAGDFSGHLELSDSRAWLDDMQTPLGADDVNTVEPLQAWVGWHPTENLDLKAGRMTLDIGSRRLVARNRFRNTLNSFVGIHSAYRRRDAELQLFYLKFMEPLPRDRLSLAENKARLDRPSSLRLIGAHITANSETALEGYVMHVHDPAVGGLTTLGFRQTKPVTRGRWYHDIEAALQFGDAPDGRAEAAMAHMHLGCALRDAYGSRVEVLLDYASGDRDPTDNVDQRFNTLAGARRFDFGPTGIYGALARTNILSPGIKWHVQPSEHHSAFLGYRVVALASRRDSFAYSGLQDTTGRAGRYVGQQWEGRWRWQLSAKLQWEVGAAYLNKGSFFDGVETMIEDNNTYYGYTQLTVTW